VFASALPGVGWDLLQKGKSAMSGEYFTVFLVQLLMGNTDIITRKFTHAVISAYLVSSV